MGWTCFGGSPTSADFCWRVNSRITQAFLSKNNTVVTLYLNETHFMLTPFTKDDLFVFISGPRNQYSFTFEVLNIEYYKGQAQGFDSIQLQLSYDNSGQFFGQESEAIVVGFREGSNIENYRGGPLLTSTWVLYASPRESDYKCGMESLWTASYIAFFVFFGLNFIGFFM